jgi:hypothetical protein
MSQQLDAQGEAHEALGTAVASYGHRVLSDPHTLGNLVADLLPDLPRERSLLVTGAEAGVAAEMRQHVEEQHIDPDTAVQLVARALSERRAIDPAASLWVASEYAQALGYQVRPYTAAVPPGQLVVRPETRADRGRHRGRAGRRVPDRCHGRAHVPVHQVPPGRGLVPDPLGPAHAEADAARDTDADGSHAGGRGGTPHPAAARGHRRPRDAVPEQPPALRL